MQALRLFFCSQREAIVVRQFVPKPPIPSPQPSHPGASNAEESPDPTASTGINPSETLIAEEILEATLDLVISLMKYTVEGVDGVSVSLMSGEPGEFHTTSATSSAAREIDAVQYATDEGPCVEAARTGQPVRVVIATERHRWPSFTDHAHEHGMRSVLSVPLVDGERVIGALNAYSQRSRAFADHEEHLARHFSRHAVAVLRNVTEFMTSDRINHQLAKALSKADVVGQAKGMLMAKGYTPDGAMATLRRASHRTNRKLSQVAEDMVSSSRRVRPS